MTSDRIASSVTTPPANKAKLTKWIGDAVPMPLGYVAGLSALAPLITEQ